MQFVGIAQGSLAEAETQLILAKRLGYVSDEQAQELLSASGEISRMLAALATSLAKRKLA